MADNRQQKNSANKQGFKKQDSKDTIRTEGHKTFVIRGGEVVKTLWKGMEVGPENHSRPRVGKTAKDAANGAKRRNADNKQSRASWQGDNRASISNFPYNSCNGKRNRTVYTGKGNERVTVSYK